jgi:hypothetical protein
MRRDSYGLHSKAQCQRAICFSVGSTTGLYNLIRKKFAFFAFFRRKSLTQPLTLPSPLLGSPLGFCRIFQLDLRIF